MAITVKNGAQAPDTDIVLNISHWDMDTIEAWQSLVTSEDEPVTFGKMREYLAQHGAVESWALDGDPADPASWRKLHPYTFKEVLQAVGEAIGNFFQIETDSSQ